MSEQSRFEPVRSVSSTRSSTASSISLLLLPLLRLPTRSGLPLPRHHGDKLLPGDRGGMLEQEPVEGEFPRCRLLGRAVQDRVVGLVGQGLLHPRWGFGNKYSAKSRSSQGEYSQLDRKSV